MQSAGTPPRAWQHDECVASNCSPSMQQSVAIPQCRPLPYATVPPSAPHCDTFVTELHTSCDGEPVLQQIVSASSGSNANGQAVGDGHAAPRVKEYTNDDGQDGMEPKHAFWRAATASVHAVLEISFVHVVAVDAFPQLTPS